MKILLKTNNSALIFGVPLLLILSMILITTSDVFKNNIDVMSVGITADLLFTIPVFYFLLLRKTNIPKTTTIPLFVIGMLIASYIIPKEYQSLLLWTKNWIFPFVELGVLTFVIYKIHKASRHYKTHTKHESDVFVLLKEACMEIAPQKIAGFLATEFAVLYYGFISWKNRTLTDHEFTYHKNSGTISLLFAFILVIGIETFVLHILLAKWSVIAAWVASIISIYSSIQIFGFLRSITKRPISIKDNTIYLRYGILSETIININDIESIEITTKNITDDTIKKLSPLGELEDHNIVITLNKENILTGLYGIQKKYQKIAFFVDDKDRFKNKVDTLTSDLSLRSNSF